MRRALFLAVAGELLAGGFLDKDRKVGLEGQQSTDTLACPAHLCISQPGPVVVNEVITTLTGIIAWQ